ncbi:MAG: hypothetical protein K0S32_4237 [Bacteroidetes bacterium]|jgi:hypothetical protein|nr:hypothetical protein [Bacteroidota bacterium]
MTLTEQVKKLSKEIFITEDNEQWTLELRKGLSEKEISKLEESFPGNKLPDEYKELLKFTIGFEFYGAEAISFDAIDSFGFDGLFVHSIELGQDGLGNCWILDVDDKGNFGKVFFVCHDPAVIIQQSENLLQFLNHLGEYAVYPASHKLITTDSPVPFDIWKNKQGLTDVAGYRQSPDPLLKEFALSLSDNYFITDLRNSLNGSGFAWGKFGADSEIKRCNHELVWGIGKHEKKKGFFSKLF